MATTRYALHRFLTELLKPQDFADYGPNGLQIEGAETIDRIAFAVSNIGSFGTLKRQERIF